MAQFFDQKDPSESVVLTFDFSLNLATGETLSGSPVVSVTLVSGSDPSPSAILTGNNGIDSTSTKALVGVHAGIAGCEYEVKAVCSTTNSQKVLALGGILPVIAA